MWRVRVERLDVDDMLARPCGKIRVRVMTSMTEHEKAAVICLARDQFESWLVIR